MIHIRYALKESPLHGVGLYADEDVKVGQVIYTASPTLDLNITEEQFKSLSDAEKREVRWWGFWEAPSKRWHVDFDVTKFVNHEIPGSVTQDTTHSEAYLVAARDIRAGEEMTQNYLEFESEEDLKTRGL